MAQAGPPISMSRRALLGAAPAAPFVAMSPSAAPTLPNAPPGMIWVCVRSEAWRGLIEAARALAP
jgi:hypothetical protein